MTDSFDHLLTVREKVLRLFESHGVTVTPQRLQVGEVMFARPQHLSADQILSAIRRQGVSVSKATVYNTLNLFVERGLVRELNVDPSRLFYDSNTRPHHHFYNADTGDLVDIDPDEVVIDRLPELPIGTIKEGVEVVVRIRNRD